MKKQIKKRWYKDWKSWIIILLVLGVAEMAMEEDCEAQSQNEKKAIEEKADVKEEIEEEASPEIIDDAEVEEVIAELTTEDVTYSVLGRDFDLLTGDSNIVYEKGLIMIKTSSRTSMLSSIFNHDGTVTKEGAVDSAINDFKAVAKALIGNDIDFDHLSMGFSRNFESGNLISDVANLAMTREELEDSINHESWESFGKTWLRHRGKLFIHPDFQ